MIFETGILHKNNNLNFSIMYKKSRIFSFFMQFFNHVKLFSELFAFFTNLYIYYKINTEKTYSEGKSKTCEMSENVTTVSCEGEYGKYIFIGSRHKQSTFLLCSSNLLKNGA